MGKSLTLFISTVQFNFIHKVPNYNCAGLNLDVFLVCSETFQNICTVVFDHMMGLLMSKLSTHLHHNTKHPTMHDTMITTILDIKVLVTFVYKGFQLSMLLVTE